MALSVTAQYPAAIPSTIPTYDFTVDKMDTVNKEHELYHNRLKNELIAMATEMGINPSGTYADLTTRLDTIQNGLRPMVNVQLTALPVTNSTSNTFATGNSTNFNQLQAFGAADWYFPPGSYSTLGFVVTATGSRIWGAGGQLTTFTMDGTGNCVFFAGTDAAGYAGRLYNVGMNGVKLQNRSTGTNIGLKIRHVTGSLFQDVWTVGFRGDGGGVHAHDFADSFFLYCHWDFCGSGDDTDKAVIMFCSDVDGALTTPGTGTAMPNDAAFLWAVDQIRFYACRWENNGDRICNFKNDATHTLFVNKIQFLSCKFENSVGTNPTDGNGIGGSASGCQFLFDNCSWISFLQCEWTYGDMRLSHAVIPCVIRMVNSAQVHITDCVYHFGSKNATKLFTNFVQVTGTGCVLVLNSFFVKGGGQALTTSYPDPIINCTVAALVIYECVGFIGFNASAKNAANWIGGTAPVNTLGGAGGGIIA